jgi:hypothetical protein
MNESRTSQRGDYWSYDDEDIPNVIPADLVTPEFVANVIVNAADQGESIKRALRRMVARTRPQHFVMFAWTVAGEAWSSAQVSTEEAVFLEYAEPRATPAISWAVGIEPCIEMVHSAIDVYENSFEPGYGMVRLFGLQSMLTQALGRLSESILRVGRQLIPSLGAPPGHYSINWIAKSIELYRAEKREESLDVIFDSIDEMLLESKFAECDAALSETPVDELSNAQLLTFLTATVAAREHLPSRNRFVGRVKSVLKQREADAPRLLAGLE